MCDVWLFKVNACAHIPSAVTENSYSHLSNGKLGESCGSGLVDHYTLLTPGGMTRKGGTKALGKLVRVGEQHKEHRSCKREPTCGKWYGHTKSHP
jgi:hypothetical protein